MIKLLALIDEVIAEKGNCKIIDIGGRFDYWLYLKKMWEDRPLTVTLVDLEPTEVEDTRFVSIRGNACNLSEFADMSFDIAFSNSVLEHVGTWKHKTSMAQEVRRIAPRYFIQTPNFWFPVEPHFRSLFFHWLPRPVRRFLIMHRNFAFHRKADCFTEAYRIIDDADLLDHADMVELFPDARIEKERFAIILTKSLIAVR